MISVEGLKVEFNATALFEDVSYVINKKDRIALVGKNGAGKSTMLKILAGLQQPTAGVVAVPRECTIGYLPQVMILSDKRTVMQEAELAFEHIFEMQAGIERMNQQLAERTDYDSEDYQKLIDRFTHENERFLMMGGTNYRAEIERTLQGLGFSREDFDRSTSEFSGGWRMRIELAKLLLRRPDVLLLDEPTNHLDIHSREALENALASYGGTLLIVSHDRYLINKLADRIVWLGKTGTVNIDGNYDRYIELKEAKAQSEQAVQVKVAEGKKNDYKERKERESTLRKLSGALKRCEQAIDEIGLKTAELAQQMSQPEIATDFEISSALAQEIEALKEKEESLTAEWMELSEQIEAFT